METPTSSFSTGTRIKFLISYHSKRTRGRPSLQKSIVIREPFSTVYSNSAGGSLTRLEYRSSTDYNALGTSHVLILDRL
jgi:hypothetical protein